MGLTIGVDIGGTKVAAGVVDEDGRILARVRRDTPLTTLAVPRTSSPRPSRS
jgi:glucokinase